MTDTVAQFEHVIGICREIYAKKLKDYGPAWRILRATSLTDQIFIKANRIRSIETKGVSRIDEGVRSELIGIVNYGIIGLIQLELGYAKNHDYDEAWRLMRPTSYTDLILSKVHRTKQIEDNQGVTLVSEGVDANYMDMVNYALFGLIRIEYAE